MSKALHPFEHFLQVYMQEVASKTKQLNQATWLLETTGSADAADLQSELDIEVRLLFNNQQTYQKLLEWDKDSSLNPLLKRQLNVLIRKFKQNIIPQTILTEISKKESTLLFTYANFRPNFEGQPLSENGIRDLLKKEKDPTQRQKAWNASKEIGNILAPQVLSLVNLRNQAAASLGYRDYFQMQLELQEIDEPWLMNSLSQLADKSETAYHKVLDTVENEQCKRYHVSKEQLGPWAWSEPFGQEDPISTTELDQCVANVDICEVSRQFFQKMGFDIQPILKRSDLYERPGKNQHAFCISIDRGEDVRTLCNIKNSIKWLETVLHELGHAIYDLGIDKNLPWLLREPPHMIPTEAMALIAGRQAYSSKTLFHLLNPIDKDNCLDNQQLLIKSAKESLQRRQLIFSRWVLVMTHFERELYSNPNQDLNKLWWDKVNTYQKIRPPIDRENKNDWAAKYHIGLAPIYYFSYLLGEMFASAMQESIFEITGSDDLASEDAGKFFQERLFFPGNSMNCQNLIQQVISKPLTPDAWIRQFG